MGVRSNTGNIITNATQIGSVAATTASGLIRGLADASKTLRNKKKQEYEKSLNPSTYANAPTPERAEALGKAMYAEKEKKFLGEKENEVVPVDNLLKNNSSDNKKIVDGVIKKDMSGQSTELNGYILSSLEFTEDMNKLKQELTELGVM